MPNAMDTQRMGRGAHGEYYLDYNAESLRFPRNVFHAPKLKTARALAAALPDGARVLDAGCGAGHISAGLAPRLLLTGVDIEEEAVEYCRRTFPGAYLVSDLASLPLPPDSQDLILFTNAIEHLVDPHPVLAELARVLKPGGTLFVTTENCANVFWVLLEQTWHRFFGGPCKPYRADVHPQRYTPRTLRADLAVHFTVTSLTRAVLGMELLALASK